MVTLANTPSRFGAEPVIALSAPTVLPPTEVPLLVEELGGDDDVGVVEPPPARTMSASVQQMES